MVSNEEVLLLFKGVDNVSSTANSVKKSVEGIGNSATGIKGKIQGIASSFDVVSSSITGVVGGLSLASMATDAWAGATEKQMNQLLLARKYGDETAQSLSKGIQEVVKNTPGDDSFLTSMLSTASLQAKMTTEDFEDMADAISDYTIMSQAAGSSLFETQGEIRNYLMTGETGRMRDTALVPYLDQMENASDVTERVKILNTALDELGYKGASNIGSAANSMETFKGTMQQALTNVGETFLPIVQQILDGFLHLDDLLGGNLSTSLVIVGGGLAALTTGAGILGATLPAITSGFDIMRGVLFGTQAAEEALSATTTIATGAVEAQTGVTELLAASQFEAGLAEAGLTEAEFANMASMYGATTAIEAKEVATASLSAENIGAIASQMGLTEAELTAAVAHAGNIPILEAEGLAAAESSTGFWAMAAAELAALAPIILIVAAVAALIVVVEQIGESLGWWTDFSTMLDAIRAGVERLWDAFINSPQVQGTLAAIQNAFQSLMTALQPVFSWLTAAWNNLFKSEGAGSGGPDVVGQLINLFGMLGNVASAVFSVLQQGFNTVAYVMSPLVEGLMSVLQIFSQLSNGSISWENAFVQVILGISTALVNFQMRVGQIVLQIGQALLNGIIGYARLIPIRLWAFFLQTLTRILTFGTMAATRARQAGMQILNGVVSYIRQLPGRVGAYMMQVPGRIAAAAGAAVGAAASLASQVVSAVQNGVVGVADAVYNEFINIGGRINDAVSSAVSAATSFGDDIKSAVLGALGIASPGIIQKKIAIEFQDIPGRIGESNAYVYSAAKDYAGNILNGFNAPQLPLNTVRQNANYTPTSQTSNMTIIHVHENAVPIDARNMTKEEATGVVTLAFENIGRDPTSQGG